MAETPRLIFELSGAYFRGYRNELALDEKSGENDPVAFRFGGRDDGVPGQEYVAKISFDILEGPENSPTRREKGFIGLKFDPNPIIDFWFQPTIEHTEDATIKPTMSLSARGIELFDKPFILGQYHMYLQRDGNFVVYDTSQPREGLPGKPVSTMVQL